MAESAKLYVAMGGAVGCQALARALYAHVEHDAVLRPLFPSTFKCAIEEFSAFLVQFLGGEAEQMQPRWWLSLSESHRRFSIGEREREAWLRAMTVALADESVITDAKVRAELIEFFRHSSTYIVNQGKPSKSERPLSGELAALWEEQVSLDNFVAAVRSGLEANDCIELLERPELQARFARSPAVYASVLALAATSKIPLLRNYAAGQIRAHPSLVHERHKRWRTLLHDAAGEGEVEIVELLLDMGAGKFSQDDKAPSPLYCVANECSAPGASEIVRILLRRDSGSVNAAYGVKRCTPLHMAARRGNLEVISALLDGGAEIEARDSVGETPLRRAVNCNKVEAVRLLLARGADRHSVGSKQLTAELAARSEQMKRVFAMPQRGN